MERDADEHENDRGYRGGRIREHKSVEIALGQTVAESFRSSVQVN